MGTRARLSVGLGDHDECRCERAVGHKEVWLWALLNGCPAEDEDAEEDEEEADEEEEAAEEEEEAEQDEENEEHVDA